MDLQTVYSIAGWGWCHKQSVHNIKMRNAHYVHCYTVLIFPDIVPQHHASSQTSCTAQLAQEQWLLPSREYGEQGIIWRITGKQTSPCCACSRHFESCISSIVWFEMALIDTLHSTLWTFLFSQPIPSVVSSIDTRMPISHPHGFRLSVRQSFNIMCW